MTSSPTQAPERSNERGLVGCVATSCRSRSCIVQNPHFGKRALSGGRSASVSRREFEARCPATVRRNADCRSRRPVCEGSSAAPAPPASLDQRASRPGGAAIGSLAPKASSSLVAGEPSRMLLASRTSGGKRAVWPRGSPDPRPSHFGSQFLTHLVGSMLRLKGEQFHLPGSPSRRRRSLPWPSA
jgi:hypothetical protein